MARARPCRARAHARYNRCVPAPRIAFLILAHQDAPLLERLCRRLGHHAVFVHVDAAAADFPVKSIAALPQVELVSPRHRVHWGDFSMIEATLTLMRTAHNRGPFDRFVLLSGACYPVKPLAELEAAFAREPDREWMAVTPISPHSRLRPLIGRRWRMAPLTRPRAVDVKVRALWNRASKWIGRDLEREIGMTPHFGSQWWGLSRACVAKILSFVDANPAFARSYRTVYAPDEHFFQTIVANSEFGAAALRVEDRGDATNQLAPLHLIAPAADRYFRSSESDFALAASTPRFFIRKVSTARSAGLLDRIDVELLQASHANRSDGTAAESRHDPSALSR